MLILYIPYITDVDTVYLLLEVIATNRTLAVEFKSKIEWFKVDSFTYILHLYK